MTPRDPRLPSASGLLVVGKDVPRTDAVPKVTGAAQYVADLHFPGMLHAAVLRSPHPHARIVSIDTSAAAAMPGVLPHTPLSYEGNRLVWSLPDPYSNLEGERVERRFKALANLLDREPEIRVGTPFQLAAG